MSKVAGGTELTGIWVGKFKASDNGSSKIITIPNIASWRTININDIFLKCQDMDLDNATYGITTSIDTHLMKNGEWGAVAYLSKYVLWSTEVSVNDNTSYITAKGNIVTYKAQSTTGNEYGIYDMSGCSYGALSAYVNNNNSSLTTYGNSVYTCLGKYKDVFPVGDIDNETGDYDASIYAYGFAVYETSLGIGVSNSWFSDYCAYPNSSSPFFIRGGYNASTNGAGLFSTQLSSGNSDVKLSFRVSAVVP